MSEADGLIAAFTLPTTQPQRLRSVGFAETEGLPRSAATPGVAPEQLPTFDLPIRTRGIAISTGHGLLSLHESRRPQRWATVYGYQASPLPAALFRVAVIDFTDPGLAEAPTRTVQRASHEASNKHPNEGFLYEAQEDAHGTDHLPSDCGARHLLVIRDCRVPWG